MFDEMSHWDRLCGKLNVSPDLILLLDSRLANVAKEKHDELRRRSGNSNHHDNQ